MKRIAAAALTVMFVLCGCGQTIGKDGGKGRLNTKNAAAETNDKPYNASNSENFVSGTEKEIFADTAKNVKESNTDKNSYNNIDTTKDKLNTSSSVASVETSSEKPEHSKDSSQNNNYTVGSSDDPIQDIRPENVQQVIIEESIITTEPEPESTYVNKYENIDISQQVDVSWFDNCVIMGDSLTVGLSLYNDAYGTLGNAKFVCASSLSYGNAQWDINAPYNVHPYYNGQKILLEDAAVVTGAKKAIITLGMNDISIWGADGSIDNARSLINKIKAKSPDLRIYLETVTPMIYDRQKERLNNQLIRQFNENLKLLAEEESCGFLNSYDAFANSNGNLPYEFCSDPDGLGLHFNFQACEIWAEFLRSNVGNVYPCSEPLLETESDSESKSEPVIEPNQDSDVQTDLPNESDSSKE